jgi:UDP-N-acetylmuramyl pentapeptide synthase
MGQTQMGFSEAILRGDQANEILALCQGDQLVLYANDTKLLQVTDDTFSYGDVGLIAGNLSTPGTDILFNYFIVLKP